MPLKSLSLLFPLFAGLSWGLLYAVSGKAYQTISLPTNIMMVGLSGVTAGLVVSWLLNIPIDFTPYFTHEKRFLFWLIPLAGLLGTFFLHYSIKNISPAYAALGEISYVLFTPLFAYVLFGVKQWTPQMLIGGALIILGFVIVMAGELTRAGKV